jgi:hypothetical protein
MCDIRAEQGWRSREAFLEAVTSSVSIDEATRAAGWTSRTTYPKNRRRFPAWAAHVEYERNIADGTEPWTPTYGGPDRKWPFVRGLRF